MSEESNTTKIELAKQVREYAERPEKYNIGWDEVAECWTTEDIIERMGNVQSLQGAVRKLWPMVNHSRKYAEEIMATAW